MQRCLKIPVWLDSRTRGGVEGGRVLSTVEVSVAGASLEAELVRYSTKARQPPVTCLIVSA